MPSIFLKTISATVTRRMKSPQADLCRAVAAGVVPVEATNRSGVLKSKGLPLLMAAAGCLAACDGSSPATDASTPLASHSAQVALRIDVPSDKKLPSLTALAYRASFSGISAREVLRLVDPLADGTGTLVAGDCELRDLDKASAALAARGDGIELEELRGVVIASADLASDKTPTFELPELLRPSPRLFPDLASSIGGVVAEGGPIGLADLPLRLHVTEGTVAAGGSETVLAVPSPSWLRQLNGNVPIGGSAISVSQDLRLIIGTEGKDETIVEIRPFGATVALACSLPASDAAAMPNETAFVVSGELLARLVIAARGTPGAPIAASLDVVRRADQPLSPAHGQLAVQGAVEVRTSTMVELRP